MRTKILMAMAILGGATVTGAEEPAPIPKEGSASYTTVGSMTRTALPLGKDHLQVSWEFLGAQLGDDGTGLTHNASVRCIGSVYAVGGEYQGYTNSCVFTRPDGDQIFATETATGKIGGLSKGTSRMIGGTGKMAGITGSSEFTRYFVRPATEGTFQTVTKSKGSYKLP
jgi:hypothetical protein